MRVEALTHHGMGRLGDGTLVPRVLPGEAVEPRPDGSWRVLEPSPDRVAPPCPHFATCGGCMVQHASDPFVARWKAGMVEAALGGQGLGGQGLGGQGLGGQGLGGQGLAGTVAAVETSPPQSRRRARLSGRRLKRGGAVLGFHARASDAIVDNPECRILSPAIMALRPALVELVARVAPRSREVALTVTDSPAGADLLVEGARETDAGLRADLAAWAARAGVARLHLGPEPVFQREAPWQPAGRARVVPPPGAFLQATPHGEAALVAFARGAVGGASRVLDLFAGSGTFSLPLAEGAEVHAVEGDRAMTEALLKGWRSAPGLRRVTAEARDLFRRPLGGDELARFDAALLDPPRAGAEAQVRALAEARVPILAYVSCDPRSFARDARILAGAGYAMDPVTVVDQFRWSPHVELATRFRRG